METNLKEPNNSIPDLLASSNEKLTNEYGLKIAKSIGYEWFNNSGMIDEKCSFAERHLFVRKMRMYNRGEQDVEQYKRHLCRQKNDISMLNLDWTPLNIPSKFTKVVANGMSDEYYNIEIRSTDHFTVLEKKKNKLKHKVNMVSKAMLEEFRDLQGIDLVPKGFVAENEEEIELYTEIKERPKQEIAEEILINYIKKTNNWNFIKKTTDNDAVQCDLRVARVFTDPNDGVKLDYVDPETFGHSYVEKNNFSDAWYFFVVEDITINDLKRESNFNDMTLRKIAKLYAHQNRSNTYNSSIDYDRCDINKIIDYKVNVMRFCFKSNKEIVFKKYHDKKNRVRKVALRDSSYTVPKGAEKSRLSKNLDTWYEGNHIVGSDFIYDYKECENLAKDQMNKVIPPFIAQSTDIYKNKLKSFLSDIIPLCDDLQYTHLKIQHLRSELKPDLIELDLDALAEIDVSVEGQPKQKNWQSALSILNVKGVVLKKRINMGDDGLKDTPAARPMSQQQGSALGELLNIWAHTYNTIRDITGINPAVDGSIESDSLVGVNEMKRLAGNTATKHLVDAALEFDKRVCECISSRIKLIYSDKNAKHIVKLYDQAVGKHNVSQIENLKNRHLHEFGFTIELVPSKEQFDELREDLSIALQEQSIDISEKHEIMRIARSNIKQAAQYMHYLRGKKIKLQMEREAENMRQQSITNQEAAAAKADNEIRAYQAKKEIDLQFQTQLSAIELEERQAIIQIEAPEKDREFNQQVYLENLKNYQTISLTKFKEDQKTMRERKNSTRQSKMVHQRTQNTGPIDFDNELDITSV